MLSVICNCFAIQWDYYKKSQDAYVNGEEVIYAMDIERMQWEESVATYPAHVDALLKDIQNKMRSPLYLATNASQIQYLQQSQQHYEKLQNKQMQVNDTMADSYVFNFPFTSYLFLFILCMICYNVFVEDFENGASRYLLCMRKGQKHLAFMKYIATVLLSIGCYFIIMTSSMITSVVVIGGLQPQQMLQAIRGFIDAPYGFTILQYFLLYTSLRLLFILVFTSLFSFVANLTKSLFYTFSIVGIGIGIELLLFTTIPDESYLVLLKQINIMMLYFIHPMFQQYTCMHLFGFAIPLIYVIIFFFTIILILFTYLGIRIYSYVGLKKLQITLPWNKKHQIHSLLFYEAYKFGYLQKAVLILIAFIFLQFSQSRAYHPFVSVDQYYYQIYSQKLQGECNLTKDAWLQEQASVYEKNDNDKEILGQAFQEGRISEVEFQSKMSELNKISVSYDGFKKAKTQYLDIKAKDGVYIDQTAYEVLMHTDAYKQYILQGMLMLIVLFFAMRSIVCIEYESSMQPLLMTTRYRLRNIQIRKHILCLIYAAIVYSITLWANIYEPFRYMQGSGLGEELRNILIINSASSMPIYLYALSWATGGYAIVLLFLYVQSIIAKRVRISGLTIICSLLCLLPLLLLYLFI